MGVKVDDSLTVGIHPREMRGGQIGIVVAAPRNSCMVGRVVQMSCGYLFQIGADSVHYEGGYSDRDWRVRILPPGTKLEITDDK